MWAVRWARSRSISGHAPRVVLRISPRNRQRTTHDFLPVGVTRREMPDSSFVRKMTGFSGLGRVASVLSVKSIFWRFPVLLVFRS